MKLKVQLVVCADDGREEQVQEVATLDKECQHIEHLGLTLVEAKHLLATLQQHLVAQQATTFEEDIPSSKCFGFVQTLDTKPKRRLFEVLQSQGHQMNQQRVTPSSNSWSASNGRYGIARPSPTIVQAIKNAGALRFGHVHAQLQ
jgi:hypothetical protein